MASKYIIYNPYADGGEGKKDAEALQITYENAVIINICRISNYKAFFKGMESDDEVILCGGDGTLSRFANAVKNIEIKCQLYYFPCGTGNDFARDLGYEKHADPVFPINQYLKELPSVTVNGNTRLFLNNVGFGIDGYCTEVGDKLREKNKKNKTNTPINYTNIAIKGLLHSFTPRNATVNVDGTKYTFKRVWLAPTMNGRYYGGGMMAAPSQDRSSTDHKVSIMVFHGIGKLRALMIFPSIFKGKHIKYAKNVSIIEGNEIKVKFDRPTPLQIDGETIRNVKSYAVSVNKADGRKGFSNEQV